MYDLFISHSWSYSDAYNKLVSLLDGASDFPYRNFSVPKDDPIHNADNIYALRSAIQRQIAPARVVIVLAGVYATYSKWINEEITLANSMTKPILAIAPWGAEKTSTVVSEAAWKEVGWNTASITAAIKELSK